MIKKLKFKFILTNMMLITIVMIVTFGMLYYNTAQNLKERSISALRDIALNGDVSHNNSLFKDEQRYEKYLYLSTCTIEYDEINGAYYVSRFGNSNKLSKDDEEYIDKLISAVYSMNEDEGVLEKYNMRYYLADTPNGKRIVLLDKIYEDYNLKQLLISFSTSGVLVFAIFLIITIILAGNVVKPIEKSIKQQRQLISNVSHELKTPITVIATNADIVLSHSDSTVEQEKKWLEYIKGETERMSELVSSMLYLAKTDEVTARPTFTEINLSNTVYEIALPFESVCYEKNKAFTIDVEDDVFVKGNENSIKQLIVILLDNAVKYSNDNGRIYLSLKKTGDKAILCVHNTGEPIPKENISYLFDRFYRMDQARSHNDSVGGSGLGLSIAKRIIESNEANISVTSNMEHGTSFSCSFNITKQKYNKQLNK